MRRRSPPAVGILRALPLLAAILTGAGGAAAAASAAALPAPAVLPAAAVPIANQGAVTVTPAAALEGGEGLRVAVDGRLGGNQRAFLVDDSPAGETTYRAVFWLDARRLQMAGGDAFVLFEGVVRSGGPGPRLVPAFRLVVRKGWRFAAPRLLGEAFAADRSRRETATIPLPARRGPHRVQVEWRAAAGEAAAGLLRVTLLGDRPQTVAPPPLANAGQRLVSVRLGAVGGIDPGTQGSFDLDGFASFRDLAGEP